MPVARRPGNAERPGLKDVKVMKIIRSGLAVDFFSQFFADFEERQLFRFNLDDFPGFRITSHVGLVVFDNETAEAADLDTAAAGQGFRH